MKRSRRPPDPTAPTERQADVLAWISRFCLTHHRPPSVREVSAAYGLRSPVGMSATIDALRAKGLLVKGILRPTGVMYTCAG